MGDDMVVAFSFDAFAHDELLARRLVSFGGALTTRSSFSRENSLVPSTGRILYRFVDSDTGCNKEVVDWRFGHIFEVVEKAHPICEGGGISECVFKMSVKIKVEDASSKEVPSSPSERDRPAEETGTPSM